MPYLDPTQESGEALMARQLDGPVTMLNLLRFREVADYSANPELAPDEPISGVEAYQLYAEHTMPYLIESGGELVLAGDGGDFLIGPSDERWDHVLLVRQRSLEDFFAFTSNPGYLAGLGHRAAALEDSRILPIAGQT
jgi:hypothetical protein